jgi:anti-sigma factor RsiW
MMHEHRFDLAEGHPSEALLLLALDHELDAQDAAVVSAHVRACAACQAASARLAALSADVEEYCYAWPSVEEAAPASARASRSTPARAPHWQTSRSQRSSRPRAPVAAAWAAAAAILLLAAAAATWMLVARSRGASASSELATRARTSTQDIALTPSTSPRVERAAPIASVGSASGSTAPALPAATPHRPRRSPSATKPRPTYYWALPYSNGALPLDQGAVEMTVSLSREQLRLAGIPVGDSHSDSRVRAKVLLGADGLPRAISFDAALVAAAGQD